MAFFGLDIGSYAIKFVKVDPGSTPKVKVIGAVYNPVGQILPSDPNQFQQLAEVIKVSIKEHKLSGDSCHLSVPGLQAYISVVSMPVLSDAELSSAIKWEAEQHIPVALSEVNFEYDVIFRPPKDSQGENMSVFLVGVPKTTVARFLELLRLAGVEPVGLEPEVVSLLRTFFPKKAKGPMAVTLVCNLGATASSFMVVDAGRFEVVHSASVGSLSLTRALEKAFSLRPAQAEEYKRTYGLLTEHLEGKVRAALEPVFGGLVNEIKKTVQFYNSKTAGKKRVARLLLSGGGANLPGMTTYLAQTLSVEVVVGNPFLALKTGTKNPLPSDKASYGVAAGLGLKEF